MANQLMTIQYIDANPPEYGIKVRLGCVQETLLIPLYYRAAESQSQSSLFRDEHAVRIVPQIDYDFAGFDDAWALRNDVVVRTVVFDELVRAFIAKHPSAQIINLGCGLDSRFSRVDNGQIEWYDLDMPDSIELRHQFLPPTERNFTIAQSMFQTDWFDRVDADPERPTLIVAEALLFYFSPDQVRQLTCSLLDRFPRGEMVFQSISPRIVGRKSGVPVLREMQAELKWGLRLGQGLSHWDPRFEMVDEISLVDRCPQRWRWYRWAKRLPGVGRYIREVMKVSHVKFARRTQS